MFIKNHKNSSNMCDMSTLCIEEKKSQDQK